ncbi:MAG: DNA-directed RNA polymerase subunit K [archaeon]
MAVDSDKLTRFEKARVLGARALQVSLGAPVLIKTNEINPVEIARQELARSAIKILVIRKNSDGSEETLEAS